MLQINLDAVCLIKRLYGIDMEQSKYTNLLPELIDGVHRMNVVCYGDSNTWGYDPRGYFGGRYDEPWPSLLPWKIQNLGENGREIPAFPGTFPENTDLLIVMLGTNDLQIKKDITLEELEKLGDTFFVLDRKPEHSGFPDMGRLGADIFLVIVS